MRPENRKRRGFNLSSAIGWLIFILVIAGGPIINLLRRVLGGAVTLPTNLTSLLLIAIGGLVVLSMVVSVLRALGGSKRSTARLPTEIGPPARPPSAQMPPFGGASQRPPAAPASPRAFTMPPSGTPQQRTSAPRFEPIFNPLIV